MNKTATTPPWDPDSTIFPTRKNLPAIPGAPPEAAWFWGDDDYIGRLNLLTPARVKAAAAEIKTGEVVPLEYVFNLLQTTAQGPECLHSFRPVFHSTSLNSPASHGNSLNTRSRSSLKALPTMTSTS